MSDLTRAIAEALGCDATMDAEGGYYCSEHGDYLDSDECPEAARIAAALAPLIEARVREAKGPCTCPPWHPGTDGPEEDCAQHGRPYAYWVEYAGVLEGRISDLLCDLTGGLLSKPGYDVPTMTQAVEDHFERTVVAVAWQEGYDAAESKFPGSPRVPNPYREDETDA